MTLKIRVVLFCLGGGLLLIVGATSWSAAALHWLAGIVLVACLLPVVMYGPERWEIQFAMMAAALLVITSFCTWTEALIFLPAAFHGQPFRALFGELFFYLVIALVLALLGRALKLRRESARGTSMRPVAMVTASGAAYLVYYFFFGAITYLTITYRFYSGAQGDVNRIGAWFWLIQLGRGVLMTLAVLPIIYTLRLTRGQLALAIGLILWVAGGLSPLLPPNEFMGGFQRFVHVIEIFTQNFLLGVTAVYLLTRAPAKTVAAAP